MTTKLLGFGDVGGGHTSPQDVHIFVQDTAPTEAEGVVVGDIWSDTTGNLIKRCTGVSPVTFTSIEGGGSGSMTTVKEGGSQVGGADIIVLDFGAGFDVAESPDTEINITLDLSELANQDLQLQLASLTAATELTIATGDITMTQTFHSVDTESDASSDDLVGINGGTAGRLLIIRPANDARTVVVKHNGSAAAADNILLRGGVDKSLTEIEDTLILLYDATIDTNGAWLEVGGTYFDDATSNPLIDADSAADGTENSPARKDHVHPKHHVEVHDYDTHDGGVPFAEVEFDDATSDPLIDGSAADGVENSAARKDHVHPLHHAAITVSGTPDYITLSGQDIVRGLIVLTTDVTGTLPIANGGTNLTALPDVEAWISAAAMKGLATAGAGDADKLPESRELATNDINIDFIAFDTATEEHAYFNYTLPAGWDEGTITFTPYWTAASGSGTVVFGLAGLARSNDEAIDAAVGTEVTVTDTLLAADDVHISPESAAVTIGGTPAEGDWCYFVLARKTGSDTLGVDAQLLGIMLKFKRASYSD